LDAFVAKHFFDVHDACMHKHKQLGEYPKITQKFLGGFILDVILLVVLLLYDLLRVKKTQKKARD